MVAVSERVAIHVAPGAAACGQRIAEAGRAAEGRCHAVGGRGVFHLGPGQAAVSVELPWPSWRSPPRKVFARVGRNEGV